jgi:hypothetical protein
MKKIKLQLFCLFVLFQFINFFFSKTIKLFSFRFLKWINFISNSLVSHFRYRNRHDSIGNRQEGRISVNGKCSQKINSMTLDVRMRSQWCSRLRTWNAFKFRFKTSGFSVENKILCRCYKFFILF